MAKELSGMSSNLVWKLLSAHVTALGSEATIQKTSLHFSIRWIHIFALDCRGSLKKAVAKKRGWVHDEYALLGAHGADCQPVAGLATDSDGLDTVVVVYTGRGRIVGIDCLGSGNIVRDIGCNASPSARVALLALDIVAFGPGRATPAESLGIHVSKGRYRLGGDWIWGVRI